MNCRGNHEQHISVWIHDNKSTLIYWVLRRLGSHFRWFARYNCSGTRSESHWCDRHSIWCCNISVGYPNWCFINRQQWSGTRDTLQRKYQSRDITPNEKHRTERTFHLEYAFTIVPFVNNYQFNLSASPLMTMNNSLFVAEKGPDTFFWKCIRPLFFSCAMPGWHAEHCGVT